MVDAAGAEVPPPRRQVLSLVYSSNVRGEYERCGCAVAPAGGLARRAAEIDRIRGESDGIIQVDAGDLFLPTDDQDGAKRRGRAPAPSEVERRARLIATAYARLGVAAFTPGERDLALGLPLLRRVLGASKVPTVSANLVDATGRLVFEPDLLVDAAGVKVGIFGVTSASPPDRERWRAWGVEARDPVEAARAAVASLRSRGARVVVALVHVGGASDSRRLLAAVPGVDWAVLGHSARNLETPELVAASGGGGARELEAMSLGRDLGRLDLHVVAGDGAGPFTDGGARVQLVAILADHERQIADYARRLAPTDAASASEVTSRAYDEKRLEALRQAVARERRELATLPLRPTGNWFDNRIVSLDESVPDQPEMGALVAAYNRESERLAAAGKPVGVGPPPASPGAGSRRRSGSSSSRGP